MVKIELADYLRSSCALLSPSPVMLIEIYNRSNGDPCYGCGYANNCQTKHDLKLAAKQKSRGQGIYLGETNAEIAKRLGISKRQVAKMRKNGEL